MIIYNFFYQLIRLYTIILIFIDRWFHPKNTANAIANANTVVKAKQIRQSILLESYLILDENEENTISFSFKPLQIVGKMHSINDILKHFNLSAEKSVKIVGIYKAQPFEELIEYDKFNDTYIMFDLSHGGSMHVLHGAVRYD